MLLVVRSWLAQALNPVDPDGEAIQLIIPGERIEQVWGLSSVKVLNLCCADAVLRAPYAVFSGIRTWNRDGWCYVGRPACDWYVRPDVTATFPENFVFVVYVNPRMEIYEWRAEYSDILDRNLPEGWQNRFGAIVWKRT